MKNDLVKLTAIIILGIVAIAAMFVDPSISGFAILALLAFVAFILA